MGVAVLERPAAGTHVGPLLAPVAFHLELLQRLQPAQSAQRGGRCFALLDLQHRLGGKRGVPDRRDAGLAVGFVITDHQQLLDRPAGRRVVGMIRRIAQRVVHHHGIRHRGIDRAKAVLAVQPLRDEGDTALDRTPTHLLRPQRLRRLQPPVERIEEQCPAAVRMRSPTRRRPIGRCEQLLDANAALIARSLAQCRQHQQRHDDGARPIGHARQMNGNQRGSRMISTGMVGTRAHESWPNCASRMRVKTLARSAPP